MKRSFLLVLLMPLLMFATFANAQGRYGEVLSDDAGSLFADMDMAPGRGGNGVINTDQFLYFDKAKRNYRIEEFQFSCGNHESRLLGFTVYNMDGSIKIPLKSLQSEFEKFPSDSIAAAEYDIACSPPPIYLVTAASIDAVRKIVATRWAKEKTADLNAH